jgi:hypothetical protein
MTLLYNARRDTAQAQTHALVIGVNAYAHLPGGASSVDAPASKNFGLGQLTSPVLSASAFTDWLLTQHRNPAAPLGSVRLLSSPATWVANGLAAAALGVTDGTRIAVPDASFGSIEAAFAEWYLALHKHHDNVGLFLFSGHGLEASDRYLLPADFGMNPLDPYDRAINFTVTHARMDHCLARTQCYFLDACRHQPNDLRIDAASGPIGKPLIGALPGAAYERDAPIFHAAAKGQSAAGEPGKESYFTDALIKCLDGMGARDASGAVCPVDHVSLGIALKELIGRVSEESGIAMRCSVAGEALLPLAADLHLATPPVQVLMTLLCRPPEAHAVASLSVKHPGGRTPLRRRDPSPLRVVILAGRCSIGVQFERLDPWESEDVDMIAYPPVFRPDIVIRRK